MEKPTLTTKEASKLLGITEQTLRLMAQQDLLPFIKAVKKPGSKHYRYSCFRERLLKYLKGELS